MTKQNKNPSDELQELTLYYYKRNKQIREELITQLKKVEEELQPKNILKNSLNNMLWNKSNTQRMSENLVGIGIGYLTKKLVFGNKKEIIKRVSGNLLEFAVAQVVANNASPLIEKAKDLMQLFMKRRNHQVTDVS
jgi:hypothetical protein